MAAVASDVPRNNLARSVVGRKVIDVVAWASCFPTQHVPVPTARVNYFRQTRPIKLAADVTNRHVHDVALGFGIKFVGVLPNLAARDQFARSHREVMEQDVLLGREVDASS